MKKIKLSFDKFKDSTIYLNSSKSESNRLLIIKALSEKEITIKNLSKANDSVLLKSLLESENLVVWDAQDAGTSFRFLTSFLAIKKEHVVLSGTERMKQRPIKVLVDALNKIGAEILYLENEGFPPIYVKGKINQVKNKLDIPGDISSQYISSLLLIAPLLEKGIEINIEEPFYSRPYVNMTLNLMDSFGIKSVVKGNKISIKNQEFSSGSYIVESDWSAASYWYSILSISDNINNLTLQGLKKKSNQGDSVISELMKSFGVNTQYKEDGIVLTKIKFDTDEIELDFRDFPDLAQTILVVAAYHKMKLKVSGVESLKIKETDRLLAMKNELKKIGCDFYEEDNYWILEKRRREIDDELSIDTYKDHRMAMAFAPLASKKSIIINDSDVVVKSYPTYWEDLKKVGFIIT
ncbi:MAG: 3-phosphoshikimate 1-carboxyvinyltransferase [Amoebophilaceae bacterium TMED152]|nr:MAG: 3-phosphoshikimate 1-carboxyvinyltransferase [Amoebophilaceae bacterium TMED152]|tara:strand:- start:3795 stop:5018 length:1224 start_codon:yes stop_codon:yes gene_type:complete